MKITSLSQPKAFLDVYASLLSDVAIATILTGEDTIAFGVEEDGVPMGAICGRPQGDCMVLLSLFVHPDYRRRGVAQMLLDEFQWAAFGCLSADHIQVEYCMLSPETMEGLSATLTKAGYYFYETNGEHTYETTVGELCTPEAVSDSAQPLTEIGKLHCNKIAKILQREVGTEGNVLPSSTDLALSHGIVKSGEVVAFFWVERLGDVIRIGALHGTGNPRELSAVVMAAIAKAKATLPPETVVLCDLYHGVGEKLFSRMVEGELRPCTRFASAFYPL